MTEMSRRRFLGSAAAMAGGLALAGGASAPAAAFTARVKRSGAQLTLSGNPWRMIGFDAWRAAIASWNHPANYGGYEENTGTNLADDLDAILAGCPHANTLRVWFFQQFALRSGARDWSALDKVLSVCASRGFRVVAALEDGWGYETGGGHTGLPASWFAGGYKTVIRQPWETVSYRHWVKEAVTRYKGDPRIAVWELGNEMNGISESFVSDVCGLIKSIDPGALTCEGGVGTSAQRIAVPTLDLASYHYYPLYNQTGWDATRRTALAAGKPTYLGETGWLDTDKNRAAELDTLAGQVFAANGDVGLLIWQWGAEHPGTDQFGVGPGDPMLAALDRHAL